MNKKVFLIAGGLLLAGGIGFYLYSRRKIKGNENFLLVQEFVPSGKILSSDSNAFHFDLPILDENETKKTITFFNNNRFYVSEYDKEKKDWSGVNKGYYFSGGRYLQNDDGSIKIYGKSVIKNINDYLKKL